MWFKLNWLTGEPSYVEGESINSAFVSAGYGGGVVRALNYWEEVNELPKERKPLLHSANGNWREFGGLFENALKPQVLTGNKTVSHILGNRVFTYMVEETPFSYRLYVV